MNNDMQEKKSVMDEKFYRTLISGISDYAIYMIDPGGHVSSWNAGAKRFKGYVAGNPGRAFLALLYPEDRAAGLPETALQRAREEGKYEAEGWRIRKDGSRFWAHVVIDPIYNEHGTLVGYAKVTRDVTERKHAEDALRDSEQRFRLLVQGVTDYALYMLSPEGIGHQLEFGRRAHQGLYPAGDRRPALLALLHRRRPQSGGLPQRALRPPPIPGASRPKAGACARTARASGPTW
jgi:PAS domain S-box-containing protein